jgi:hypothetical protein
MEPTSGVTSFLSLTTDRSTMDANPIEQAPAHVRKHVPGTIRFFRNTMDGDFLDLGTSSVTSGSLSLSSDHSTIDMNATEAAA